MLTASELLWQAEGADTLLPNVGKVEDYECCALMYTENVGKSCKDEDMQDHYCMYVNASEYARVTTGGVVCLILNGRQ